MSQLLSDTKINCLEKLKDEIEVILKQAPANYSFFLLISNVYIYINKFINWII